jgi:MSHA biogenesis protein MshG
LDMREAVMEGESLSDNMKCSNIFPSVAVQMVATGEKTGNLSQLLNDVADYFERETEYVTANLTTLIEPVLVFFLGMMVLMLALGVYLPIWSIMNLYKQ